MIEFGAEYPSDSTTFATTHPRRPFKSDQFADQGEGLRLGSVNFGLLFVAEPVQAVDQLDRWRRRERRGERGEVPRSSIVLT